MRDATRSNDEAALAELFRLYASTLNAGDIDAWAALWDEEGVQMPPDRPPVEGKAHILEANRSLVTELSTKMDPIVIQELTIRGDLAYTRALYNGHLHAQGWWPRDVRGRQSPQHLAAVRRWRVEDLLRLLQLEHTTLRSVVDP